MRELAAARAGSAASSGASDATPSAAIQRRRWRFIAASSWAHGQRVDPRDAVDDGARLDLVGRSGDARFGDAHVPVAELAGAAGERAVDLDQLHADVGLARIGLEVHLQ